LGKRRELARYLALGTRSSLLYVGRSLGNSFGAASWVLVLGSLVPAAACVGRQAAEALVATASIERKHTRREGNGQDLFSRLHPQRVIKPVEVIEHPDGSRELYDLAVVEVAAEFGPEFVVHRVGVVGHALGQAQRGFFRRGEI